MQVNWAHVHLMINHIPVIGVPGAVLLLIYGMIAPSEDVKKAGLGALVLLALATIAVYLTGDAAQEAVKNLPGVTGSLIGTHEESADLALVLMEVLGVTALGGLVLFRRRASLPAWFVLSVVIASMIVAIVFGVTANLGGQIRHPEIRERTGALPR